MNNLKNKQDIQFEIDQLRKDKIIYALEATATSATAIFAFDRFDKYFNDKNLYIIEVLGVLVSLYWAYAMISNYFRLKKIIKLEKSLN